MMLLNFKDTNKIINLDNVCYFEVDSRGDDYAVFAYVRDDGFVRVSKLSSKAEANELYDRLVKELREFASLGFDQRALVFKTI